MRILIATLITASIILFAGAIIADREGRSACERIHSAPICNTILRG